MLQHLSFSGTSGIVAGDPIWHEQRDGMLFFEASYTGVAKRIYMTHRNSPPREMIRDSDVAGDLAWSSLTPDGNSLLFTSDATDPETFINMKYQGKIS